MPPASPAFRCYYVGICYIVCLPPLYMRGLGYKCPTRTRLHILSKHNTTQSPTVTYLVHYIRQTHDVTYANIIALECRGSRHVPASRATGCGIVAVSWGGAPIVRPRELATSVNLVNKSRCRARVIAWSSDDRRYAWDLF